MNPILILRTEIVCLILLVYLAFISRAYRIGKDGRIFNLLLIFSITHVVMEGVTVWMVNHPDSVPRWLLDGVYIIFYLSAIFFSVEVLVYITNLCYPERLKPIRIIADCAAAVFLVLTLLGVLTIQYEPFDGTRASTGSAPMVGFSVCLLMFAVSIVMILANNRRVGKHIRMLLVPMLFLLIAVEIVQMTVKEFLFTGAALTVISIGFFFSMENPAAVLEKKILLDALSGLGSRSSYEYDMEKYDKEFMENKETPFTFVFIDINNLRSINGLYGHQEGDTYIGRIAALLIQNLRSAEHIYRMGGDEFLAVYRKNDEKIVAKDIQRVQDACMREAERGRYHPELAIGYAVSDTKYNNLRDVLRVADYMMYRDKTALKREVAVGNVHENGTRLNLYGLTDRVFDAMCLASEEFYPFMTNLETNVTRVAPGMAEFFGLESEFIQDFLEHWLEHVHPADRDGYEADVRMTLKSLKDYHFYKYRARGRDGSYVEVTCRGGLYHGRDGEPDIFCGYIVNHGAPKIRDSVTSLLNEHALVDRMDAVMENREEVMVVRMEIRNIKRAQMLYGSESIFGAMRSVADICLQAVKDRGEVYSDNGNAFVFCLKGKDRGAADEIFCRIREACGAGVIAGSHVVPLSVYAGGVQLPDEAFRETVDVRSAVLYITEEAGFGHENGVVFYQHSEGDTREEEARLLRTVHSDAVNNRDRFFLRLQPILNARTEKVTGAEALLRYLTDELGEVAPGRFISFLESDPAYTELGYDIIRNALKSAGEIRKSLPDFNINVNITALQLYSEDFIPRVLKILEEEKYPAENLILELTERCKEMEFAVLKQRVKELREAGFRVALDDMGTGFSTIDLLLHLDVNEIKLDMEFTQHMRENDNDPKFAKLLASIAEDHRMLLCFEGVEKPEERDYLRSFGDVLLQGYLFDKPLKPEDFKKKYCA